MHHQMSRLEVNIRRLLTRCEQMATTDLQSDWKLEKFIVALDCMISQLQTMPNKPSKDIMAGYINRMDFLKGLVNTAKLTNPVDRVVAVQMLPKGTSANDSIAPSITTQIHQKTAAKYSQQVRTELLRNDKGFEKDGVRQRLLSGSNVQDDDLDAILKYNRNIQEKIAENMLSMTSSMRDNALAANAIIKRDINSLEKSDNMTDVNSTKLKSESLKLEEHTKSTWRCWLWIMIAFVFVVFFNMVLFMKVAKKRT